MLLVTQRGPFAEELDGILSLLPSEHSGRSWLCKDVAGFFA